jgi:DNA-binding transcriptional ArsR family regulator
MAASSGERGKSGERREATRTQLAQEPEGLSSGELASRLGISRQAAFSHLTALVEAGQAERIGRGRGTRYRSRAAEGPVDELARTIWTRSVAPEDSPWAELAERAPFDGMTADASRLLAGALERLLRGARERDPGKAVELAVFDLHDHVLLELTDTGEGFFDWARRRMATSSAVEARLLLSKHLGDQDLRWLTRAADDFEVESGELRWRVDNLRADQALGSLDTSRLGTRVRFCVDPLRPMNIDALKDQAGSAHALVRLFASADAFPSRDQARSVMQGLEDCERVVLDFGGVREIGEGFAEEIFLLWAGIHPRVRLHPIRMRACVAEAILRVRRDG